MVPFTKFEIFYSGSRPSQFIIYVDDDDKLMSPLWETDARRFIESAISEKIEREKEKG